MATKTFEELKQLAIQIRDEKTNKQNTATRVGTAMLEHINKLEQDYYDKTTINNRTSEYNVSINHPTSGISSSNKYDLSNAIAQVPAELRTAGLTVSFLNESGDTEKWEFAGGSWAVSGFSQVGAEKFTELESELNESINKEYIDDNSDEIVITTEEGEEIAAISQDGLKAKDLQYQKEDGSYASVKDKQDKLVYDDVPTENSQNIVNSGVVYKAINDSSKNDIETEEISELDEAVKVETDDGEEILSLTPEGLRAKDFFNNEGKSIIGINLGNCWYGSTWAEYGDSFTQMFCNGDYSKPYDIVSNTGWGILVAKAINFARYKGRGISGSSIQWQNNRAKIGLVDSSTGALISTQDVTYDEFNDVPEGQTKVRDIGCSWSRITGMFPENIKDKIDVITVFLHNDWLKIEDECQWITNDETDPEWKESEYYNTYGGDYNIETWRGSICSLVMKFQAWMPNAKLILCTPASGSINYGEGNTIYPDRAYDGSQFEKSDIMRDLAKRLSIPLIDVNADCGINMLNRTLYLQDYIHPNSTDGQKMIAASFIAGFNKIVKL